MSTNEKQASNFLNRLVYFAVLLIISAIPKVQDSLAHRPELLYDPNVAETGKYLSEEEDFYVTDEDQIHMGDRYLLSCGPLKSPDETKKGYLYGIVNDIRKDGRKFMLISDELLPTREYLQLDTLVSGYILVKYKNNIGPSGRYYTILKATNIKKTGEQRIDFAAPLERTEEPNCSVSQDGITFSLDKIEYRGPVSRVFFTLETPADRHLIQYDLYFKSRGQMLSGTFTVGRYTPPNEIRFYYSSNDTEFLPIKCEPNSVYHGIMVIKAPDPGEPIYANYKYYDYTEEELLENGSPHNAADEVSTMQLKYQPEEPAGE